MNDDLSRLPRLDTDPGLEPDEGEESRLGAVAEDDGAGGRVTVFDRADRLAVEHASAPARDATEPTLDEEDDARALD